MGLLKFCLIFVILGIAMEAEVLKAQQMTCNPKDMKALEDFLNGLESSVDTWNSSSSSPNCCTWVGVTCNSSSSLGLRDPYDFARVIKLDLGNKRLTGRLSESLGNLNQLRAINLSHNFLRGSLPESLFQLPNVQSLDLSNNDFAGPLPVTINLPALRVFNISENSFRDQIPVGICENSTLISVIDMTMNYFYGKIPPGIGNCSSLENLHLGSNFLSGVLPEDLFRLSGLSQLIIQENRFLGQLDGRMGNFSNLVHLDISQNNFSGNIPDFFHRFGKLRYFSAQSNKLKGRIPSSLSNSPTIAFLGLRNNSMVGPISINCSAMVNLVSLDLGTNLFNGSIPDTLPLCTKLRNVNLARNNFNCQIPESFKNFQSLSYLSLSNSSIYNISSAFRILQQCRNLSILVLTLNFHNEELPSDPNLHFEALNALVIANSKLTGVVPQWLKGCQKLQLLDLSWNRLGGTIPPWFGNFRFLFYLDLSNNSLTGEIPKSLTGLPSLIFRSVPLEQPSPDFPFFSKKNASVRGLQYNQILSFPPTLALSNNFLSGPIWPEFGNLKKVHILDLKFNNLSGNIPSTLSGMVSIETLDLSYNNLSGEIPLSLVHLSFLSKFSVAHNRLSGLIPAGGQFQTFSSSSFEGNLGLCGDHAFPCQTSSVIPSSSTSKPKRKGAIVGMAIGVGFGTVFVIALIFLVVLRASSRREVDPEDDNDAHERKLEELGSKLVVFFYNKDNNKGMSFDELLKSTNNFDQANIVGCGGFGLVYKATLPDGRKVAIKRLSGDFGQMEREFQAEVETLSRAQHPNLVHLQGYCQYNSDRLLIYSYMENGSLDYWLHEKLDGPSSLDWDTRLQIARGAARGLAYLHQSCNPHILHRDIKSSNILLDGNFEAHLADFGLARLILPYDTHVTTDVVGTLGYIPPEYSQASVATYKGDVYSFGVVLLELVTGKRPMDMCKPKGCRDLITWVFQLKKESKESEAFDPFIYDKQHAKQLSRVLEIACLCLSESPKIRPSTQQLVSWLDNIDLNV